MGLSTHSRALIAQSWGRWTLSSNRLKFSLLVGQYVIPSLIPDGYVTADPVIPARLSFGAGRLVILADVYFIVEPSDVSSYLA